jgi:hypothetical protein
MHIRLAMAFSLPLTLLMASSAWAVGTRHFVIEEEKDFAAGKLEAVAVDSAGSVRAGLETARYEVPGADSAWDAVEADGGLLVATGNEGKLLQVSAGRTEEVAALKALALTAICRAFGRVIVGASPGGQLYELRGKELVPFAKLEGAQHVWGLAYDTARQALFAATGPNGQLFRVVADGTAQVYFDSDQPHLVSVATSGSFVLTGSSGKARLYKVGSPGRGQVLYDFQSTEVRAIAADASGATFAIANELKEGDRSSNVKPDRAAGPSRETPKKGKGVLYAFAADGTPEKLYEATDDHFSALALDEAGRPVVGTGGEGKLIRVGIDHESVILLDVEERQIGKVFLKDDRGWIVASDGVAAYAVKGVGGVASVWTSQVLDAGLRARFGLLSWDADGKVALSTRTGNTSEPDDTWSDWSRDLDRPSLVSSPVGRYFQVRVRMPAKSTSVLRRIDVPFVTDNVRPVVTEVDAKFGARTLATPRGAVKSGQPIDGSPKSTIEVNFKVDNADDDELRYFVHYRPLSGSVWYDALEPGKVLTRSEFSWETKDIPEGKYVLRVTASDELSNPPGRALRHTLESNVVLVDNSAPSISEVTVRGRVVSGRVTDGVGPVRRIEVRMAGRDEWVPFEPKDGIFDQAAEEFTLDLAPLATSGMDLFTLRVFDTAGNSEVRHLRLGEGK